MNKLKKLKNDLSLFFKSREISFAKFSIVALIVVLGIAVLSSVFFRPELDLPSGYNIKNSNGFKSDQIEIIYSARFDKYYVKIKYGEDEDFEDIRKEVENALEKFADIDDVSQINVEYFDMRLLTSDPHEEDDGNPLNLSGDK